MKWHQRLVLSTLVLIPAVIAWWCLDFPGMGIDDANIMFSYAENIANGRGMTYANNGVPVEGSTSLLWTFISSLAFLAGANETGVLILSMLLTVASVFVVLTVVDRCCENRVLVSVLVLLLLSSSFGYAVWMSLTCMDIVLWGLCIALLTFDLVTCGKAGRDVLWLPLYLLVPWVRPESYLVVPMALVLMSVGSCFGHGSWKGLAYRVGVFAVSLGALFAWRMTYFGYPFPNTYYAKVSPNLAYNLSEGWKYLCSYLGNGIPLVMMAVVIAWTLFYALNLGKRYSHWHCLGPWTLGLMLLPVWTGGDHFACFRFFQPAYPLCCLLAAAVIAKTVSVARKRFGDSLAMLAAGSSVLLLGLAFGWSGDQFWLDASGSGHRMRREFRIAELGRRNGEAISAVLSGMGRFPRMGVIGAGGIARSYRGEIVDLMGLNDVRIAHDHGERIGVKNHAAFNPEKFDDYDVELLPFSPLNTVELKGLPWLAQFNRASLHSISSDILKGLCGRPSFTSRWTCVRMHNVLNGEYCVAMVRNDFRRRLEKCSDIVMSDYMVWDGAHWRKPRDL